MPSYYTPHRTRNLYDPHTSNPFQLSRSKIDLFLNCPHCFYLDRRVGIARPPGFPFALNSAVDAFDWVRSPPSTKTGRTDTNAKWKCEGRRPVSATIALIPRR